MAITTPGRGILLGLNTHHWGEIGVYGQAGDLPHTRCNALVGTVIEDAELIYPHSLS